jgi:hypothetical protein
MVPWKNLNLKGKILVACVFMNMYVSIIYATTGSYVALFPALIAMYCGISTYNKRYQYQDAENINNETKK